MNGKKRQEKRINFFMSKIDTQKVNWPYYPLRQKDKCQIKMGIYGIYYNYKCLYIGASINCASRATRIYLNCSYAGNDNKLLWAISNHWKNYLYYYVTPFECDKSTLARYEKAFIKKYRPALNFERGLYK